MAILINSYLKGAKARRDCNLRGSRRSRANAMDGYPAGGHGDSETEPKRPVSKGGGKDYGQVEENAGSLQRTAHGAAAILDWDTQPL